MEWAESARGGVGRAGLAGAESALGSRGRSQQGGASRGRGRKGQSRKGGRQGAGPGGLPRAAGRR